VNSLGVEIAKLVGAIVGLASGIFITYWQIRQKTLSRELKLEDNPERCGRHEEAIKTLQARVDRWEEKNDKEHAQMCAQLGLMSIEIAKISRNGGGAK
jgi:hypothetical protein